MTRVTQMMGGGDDGVVAIVVAITMFALLGAALISVDAGSVWTGRRGLVTGSDAAALAAGQYFAARPLSACLPTGRAEAKADGSLVLSKNRPDAETSGFEVDPSDCARGAGRVKVSAREQAGLFFAPVFGIDEVVVESSSTVQWGPLKEVTGLRPLGLCIADHHVREWILLKNTPAYGMLDGHDDPLTPYLDHPGDNVYPGAGVVHRLVSRNNSDCGATVRNNWAWLDFNDNSPPNGRQAYARWLVEGFPGPVSLGAVVPGDEDCVPTRAGFQNCPGNPRGGNIDSALRDVQCDPATPTAACPMFPVVLYDSAVRVGGNRFRYHPAAFLGVVLRGFRDRPADDDDDDDGDDRGGPPTEFYDLEFVNLMWTGRVGQVAEGAVVHGVQICATDDLAEHCDL